MGLTWVFGFFAVGDAGFAFSLIFCLCNSFQGFVVFLLFCLRQEDVRRTIRPYFGFILGRSGDSRGRRSQPPSSTGLSPTSKSPPSTSYYSATDFSATYPASALDTNTSCVPEEKETNIDIESAEEARERSDREMAENADLIITNNNTATADNIGNEATGEQPIGDSDKVSDEAVAMERSEVSKAPLLCAEVEVPPTNDDEAGVGNSGFQMDAIPVMSMEDEVTLEKENADDNSSDGPETDGNFGAKSNGPEFDKGFGAKQFWSEVNDSVND